MMNWRKHFIEAATLIGAAVVCALISNAIAGRERKMAIVGNYGVTERPAVGAQSSSQQATTTTMIAPPTTTTAAPVAPTQQPSNPATRQPGNPTAQQPKPQPMPPSKPATAVVVQAEQFPPHPDKPYIEIGYDAVKQLHNKGALFLDARRTSVYEQGHIPGARPFSVWESDIDEKVNKLFEERGDPRQQAEPIVAYCSGGDCEDSHMLAQKLWGIQYNNVYVYKDGFPDWQKRGGAVHTGAAP
jgi:rhodanese-related sulfurtransferase